MASQRAIRAAKAFVEISGDDSKLRKVLGGVKGTMSALAVGASAAAGAVIGSTIVPLARGIGSLMASPISAASDLQETMNKFNVVFGENAAAVKRWSDQFAAQVGRSEEQIASFMAANQDLLVPMGLDPEVAAETSKTLSGLAVDLASFNNMADADVLRDLQAAMTGSGEVMKKYGVIVSQSAVNQRLLNDGMDPITATEAQKAMARLGIIMDGTTSAQGDAVRSAGSWANLMKRAKAIIDNAAAAVGSRLLPVLEKVAVNVLPWLEVAGHAAVAAVDALGATFVSASAMAAKAITYVINSFPGLQEAATDTFGGIKDALLSGEYKLAARILWLSLKTAWLTGVDALNREWMLWKKAFVDTFNSAINLVVKKWHELQNMLSSGIVEVMAFFDSSIDADAVNATLDDMLKQQLAAVDAQADKDQAARDAAFETDIGAVNKELEAARAEWAAAVGRARDVAAERANDPNAADIADDKFSQLLADLRAGDIATRVEDAVKAPTAAGDLRTTAGAGLLVGLLNRQGTVNERLLKLQHVQNQHAATLVKLTKNGPKTIKI